MQGKKDNFLLLLIEMPNQFPGPAHSNGLCAGAWPEEGAETGQEYLKPCIVADSSVSSSVACCIYFECKL